MKVEVAMKVSIIGQAAFGEAVLKRLAEDGVEVLGVSAPEPSEGGREDPLWAAAGEAAVARLDTKALKEEEGQRWWAGLDADLCVMAFVTDILPDETFSAPRLGTIQYHPSLLPKYRGSSAINWAIINGEEETGITIFWPDKGIDTGPILLQEACPIGADDTVGSLYFDRLFPMGVDAMVRSVKMVAEGVAPKVAQDHARSTYEPPCRDQHAEIRWYQPAEVIYRLIRGCNPQPGAWTTVNGEKLRFSDCKLTGELAPGMPGRVLAIGEGTMDVRLNGGVLRVERVQPAGGKKVAAAEWAQEAGVEVGFRFR